MSLDNGEGYFTFPVAYNGFYKCVPTHVGLDVATVIVVSDSYTTLTKAHFLIKNDKSNNVGAWGINVILIGV